MKNNMMMNWSQAPMAKKAVKIVKIERYFI
jgi:hypothetical protein